MKLKRKIGSIKKRWEFPILPKGEADDMRCLWFYKAVYEWQRSGKWVFVGWDK